MSYFLYPATFSAGSFLPFLTISGSPLSAVGPFHFLSGSQKKMVQPYLFSYAHHQLFLSLFCAVYSFRLQGCDYSGDRLYTSAPVCPKMPPFAPICPVTFFQKRDKIILRQSEWNSFFRVRNRTGRIPQMSTKCPPFVYHLSTICPPNVHFLSVEGVLKL